MRTHTGSGTVAFFDIGVYHSDGKLFFELTKLNAVRRCFFLLLYLYAPDFLQHRVPLEFQIRVKIVAIGNQLAA